MEHPLTMIAEETEDSAVEEVGMGHAAVAAVSVVAATTIEILIEEVAEAVTVAIETVETRIVDLAATAVAEGEDSEVDAAALIVEAIEAASAGAEAVLAIEAVVEVARALGTVDVTDPGRIKSEESLSFTILFQIVVLSRMTRVWCHPK